MVMSIVAGLAVATIMVIVSMIVIVLSVVNDGDVVERCSVKHLVVHAGNCIIDSRLKSFDHHQEVGIVNSCKLLWSEFKMMRLHTRSS